MSLEKIILIMGPPGSGKGTQGKLLANITGYEYFSTGDVLRNLIQQDTELGKRIKSVIDEGIIIPDEMMHDIFIAKIQSLTSTQGVIVDGYPRTLGQVAILEEVISRFGVKEVKALFLEADKAKLIERIAARSHGRADDDPEVINRRFDEYRVKTAPVKEYYEQKGSLIEINGDQPVEKVHEDIKQALGL